MPDRRNGKPDQPSSKRLGVMGAIAAAVVLLIILVVFVGRNVWHADEMKEEQRTGQQELNGLS